MIIKDKKDILLPSLYTFYKTNNNIDIILPIIMGTSRISIRVLDWFVTNYSKTYKIAYYLDNNKLFNVYLDYKSQLKGYKKKLFDPFCRKKRIPFYYDDENYVVSTIGQLNFFKWAITNNILTFVDDNLTEIYINMNKKKIDLISSDNITNDSCLINYEEKKIKREKNIKNIYIDKKNTIINFDVY